MRTGLVASLALLSLVASVSAQTLTDRLTWTQPNVSTVAEGQLLKFSYVLDSSAPVVVVQTCTSAPAVPPATGTVIACSAPITPPVPAGQHTLTLLVDDGFAIASATIAGKVPDAPNGLKLVVTFTVP